jgi:hypothetical protein
LYGFNCPDERIFVILYFVLRILSCRPVGLACEELKKYYADRPLHRARDVCDFYD